MPPLAGLDTTGQLFLSSSPSDHVPGKPGESHSTSSTVITQPVILSLGNHLALSCVATEAQFFPWLSSYHTHLLLVFFHPPSSSSSLSPLYSYTLHVSPVIISGFPPESKGHLVKSSPCNSLGPPNPFSHYCSSPAPSSANHPHGSQCSFSIQT